MTLRTGRTAAKNADRRWRTAFTLVELLLVMTLLIVVISLAAPSLAGFFRGRSLDSEARRLLALSHYGQSRAVSEGVPMILWLDGPGRAYGLEADSAAAERDPKAVEFELGKELQIEIDQASSASFGIRRSPTSTSGPGVTAGSQSQLPAMRFDPDGSIGEASPPAVRLRDRDGRAIWLTPSRNHLNYEIRSQTNQRDSSRR